MYEYTSPRDKAREKAAEEISKRVTATMRERQEARTAHIANQARYAISPSALARSAGREFWSAVEKHGDAAAAGDLEAVERINEAGRIAGSAAANVLDSVDVRLGSIC